MTRCYEFYCMVLKNPEFCEEKSDTTVYNVNRYITAMQARGVKFVKSPEDKALFNQLQHDEKLTEKTVIQPKEDNFIHEPQLVEPSSEKCPVCETETKTDSIPKTSENERITERSIISSSLQHVTPSSEKCPVCETEHVLGVLPEDIQKQVQECVERARLSPEEAEDLVTVVQQTPKEEISRVFLTPRAFIYQLHAKKPASKPEVRAWKPQETAEHRQAIMHPQHSRMEEALLLKLHQKGFHPITDKEFCVQPTTPDFYFPDKNVAIYIDGEPHRTKENRDNQLRELLTKRYGVRVVSISYGDFTDEETERLFQQILETLA